VELTAVIEQKSALFPCKVIGEFTALQASDIVIPCLTDCSKGAGVGVGKGVAVGLGVGVGAKQDITPLTTPLLPGAKP
jgi:hypothetical protein